MKIEISEDTDAGLVDSLETVYNRGGGSIDFQDIGKKISDGDMETFQRALIQQYPIESISFYQFRFSNIQIGTLFDGLDKNQTVRELYFDEPNFDDFAYYRLGRFLKESTTLRKLTLTFTDLTDDQLVHLNAGLLGSKSLIKFEFTSSRISSELKLKLLSIGAAIIFARQTVPDKFPTEFQMILDGIELKMTDD